MYIPHGYLSEITASEQSNMLLTAASLPVHFRFADRLVPYLTELAQDVTARATVRRHWKGHNPPSAERNPHRGGDPYSLALGRRPPAGLPLLLAHERLDEVGAAAYGCALPFSDKETLERLLGLKVSRNIKAEPRSFRYDAKPAKLLKPGPAAGEPGTRYDTPTGPLGPFSNTPLARVGDEMHHIQGTHDHRRAEELTAELRRLASKNHETMALGERLHEAYSSELWREHSDSWTEYVHDVGLSAPMEFQARKNYMTFVLDLRLDPTDRRLVEAPPSKLFVGTRTKFKRWVSDNLDQFLDYVSLPVGEGGLTRDDLFRHLTEQVGGHADDEDNLARNALRAFRHAAECYRELSDDSWVVFFDALCDAEDLRAVIGDVHATVSEWDQDIEISIDD